MDGPYSSRATTNKPAERLRRLQKHIDSWNNLEWVESRITVPNASFYAFCGGVLLVLSDEDEALTCIQLPSQIRDLPLRMWKLPSIIDIIFGGMAADPRSDLLVLLTLE